MDSKWVTVADRLRTEIASGELHGELASETELMDRFRVSRTTIRRALGQLEGEGLVEGSQGSRRRVREDRRWCWPMHEWERRHRQDADAWAVSITDQGGKPVETVSVSIDAAPPEVAKALGIEEGATIVARKRIRSVDGEPHQLADSYFPYDLVKDFPRFMQPGNQSAKGGLLAASGLPQVRFSDLIEARMPTPEEAAALRMPAGTPLLVHRRTGYTKDGKAVRHMVTKMSANRVEISYDLPVER